MSIDTCIFCREQVDTDIDCESYIMFYPNGELSTDICTCEDHRFFRNQHIVKQIVRMSREDIHNIPSKNYPMIFDLLDPVEIKPTPFTSIIQPMKINSPLMSKIQKNSRILRPTIIAELLTEEGDLEK